MRRLPAARVAMVAGLVAALAGVSALAAGAGAQAREIYEQVPTPPGFRVVDTELEGPVYADAAGRTLYVWPSKKLRNGYSGEMKGKPACYGKPRLVTAGLMSPYPAGLRLPDADQRKSCTDLWPPVLAGADAQPVGKWTIVARSDGHKQWAYDEQPLYTSARDHAPGDTLGGTNRLVLEELDAPAMRGPIGPPPQVPAGFHVTTTSRGRLLSTDRNYSVYTYDEDTANESHCTGECATRHVAVPAPALAQPRGEWGVIERSPGQKQWTFRGHPLYKYLGDTNQWSQEGGDEPGWHNVYTQLAPPPPPGFTQHDTDAGVVLADAKGMTIYTYHCGDDSLDQLDCDHPDDTQAYRLAVCGGGDANRCIANWLYVRAAPGTKSGSRTWTVMHIDPASGHRAAAGQAGAIDVWAYRERPVYTYAGDHAPGDTNGDNTGEWRGYRNGLKAFWLRDEYYGGEL